MSVSELERRAGLKPSTVQNILHGRSKNPGIDTIKCIAHALHCSIEELIGELNASIDLKPEDNAEDLPWNASLFIKGIETVQSILEKKKKLLSKKQILATVEEIYKYALDGDSEEIDPRFTEWLLDKIIRR
jgi:transcriptional regulator with XRE-family HTH domain